MRWISAQSDTPRTDWLQTPRGQALARIERRQLQAVAPCLIGYRMLQIGSWGVGCAAVGSDRMFSAWVASMPGETAGDVCFDGRQLPIRSDSVDTVILPHALERCASPRRLLREVDRVLCDRGQIILSGFNPLHPSAMARRASMFGTRFVTARNLYSASRVHDWLELLDFEIIRATRYGTHFPYLPAAGIDWLEPGRWRLAATFAQAYLLLARKRTMRATLLERPRKRRARMAPAGIPAGAPRTHSYSEAA